MPTYQYKCKDPSCGLIWEVVGDRDRKPEFDIVMRSNKCPDGVHYGFKPFYGSVKFNAVVHEHFSPATGTVVSSHKQFERDLKRQSEEATARTGIPCNYVPVDLNDKDTLGVTDEGLQSTHDAAVARGELDPAPRML